MTNVQRVSAPLGYKWTVADFVARLRHNPLDFVVFIVFTLHILGYFCLLIVLKVRHCRKKLFAVSQ